MKDSLLRSSLLILVFILFSPMSLAGNVKTSVDRKEIALGQTFNYVISFKDQSMNVQPDLSPLTKDFELLGTSRSTRVSVINGVSQMEMQLRYVLQPKYSGKLTIPALTIGAHKTQPIAVNILAHAPSNTTSTKVSDQDVFIRTAVDNRSPYVQQQLIYTVQIFYRRTITNDTLTDPNLENALIMRIDDGRRYRTNVKGKTYHVLAKRYVLFPQKSGSFHIIPPVLTGYLADTNTPQGMPGFFTQAGKPVRVFGNNINLKVKAIPAKFNGNSWLPAKDVSIRQQWSDELQHFQVGNAITRTILITAIGLAQNQLPDISPNAPSSISTYPDPAKAENSFSDGNIIGSKVFKIAYVPNKAGRVTLPKISIPWWNVTTNRLEVATLPALKINVKANPKLTTPTTPKPQRFGTKQKITQIASKVAMTASDSQDQAITTSIAWKMVAIIFAICWLITLSLFFWIRQRRQRQTVYDNTSKHQASLSQSLKKLKTACNKQDAKAAQLALINWANALWPEKEFLNLGQIRECIIDQELHQALMSLQNFLYSNNTAKWQAAELYKLIKQYQVKRDKSDNRNILPSLYKTQNS